VVYEPELTTCKLFPVKLDTSKKYPDIPLLATRTAGPT
jgi:hypothetical protein